MKCLIVLFLTLFTSLSALGIQMIPMEGEFVVGKNKFVEFTLRNSVSYHVGMKVGVFERNPNLYGQEGLHKPADEKLFEVYKPNVILYPKGDSKGRDIKKVRVYYKGRGKLSIEKAYRVIAQQMPVDLDRTKKKKSKMRFLAKFVGALYVTPSKAKPNLVLKNIKNNKGKLSFQVQNKGNRRDFMESVKITFTAKDKNKKSYKREFTKEILKGIYHHTILAGRTREFTFQLTKQFLSKYPYEQKLSVSM